LNHENSCFVVIYPQPAVASGYGGQEERKEHKDFCGIPYVRRYAGGRNPDIA